MAKIGRKQRSAAMREAAAQEKRDNIEWRRVKRAEARAARSRVCAQCGVVLAVPRRPELGGRRRLYCGAACRLAAWRWRQAKPGDVCADCGGWMVVLPDGRSAHVVVEPGGRLCGTAAHVGAADRSRGGRSRDSEASEASEVTRPGLRDDQVVELGPPEIAWEVLSLG